MKTVSRMQNRGTWASHSLSHLRTFASRSLVAKADSQFLLLVCLGSTDPYGTCRPPVPAFPSFPAVIRSQPSLTEPIRTKNFSPTTDLFGKIGETRGQPLCVFQSLSRIRKMGSF